MSRPANAFTSPPYLLAYFPESRRKIPSTQLPRQPIRSLYFSTGISSSYRKILSGHHRLCGRRREHLRYDPLHDIRNKLRDSSNSISMSSGVPDGSAKRIRSPLGWVARHEESSRTETVIPAAAGRRHRFRELLKIGNPTRAARFSHPFRHARFFDSQKNSVCTNG